MNLQYHPVKRKGDEKDRNTGSSRFVLYISFIQILYVLKRTILAESRPIILKR